MEALFDVTFDVPGADAASPLADDAGEEDERSLRVPTVVKDAAQFGGICSNNGITYFALREEVERVG